MSGDTDSPVVLTPYQGASEHGGKGKGSMCPDEGLSRESDCLCVPDCEICPAVKRDIDLFLNGTMDEYVEEVAKYNSEPDVLANARNLKNCTDTKLTEEDKEHVSSVLVGLALCVCASGPCLGGLLRAVQDGGYSLFLSTMTLPWESGRRSTPWMGK